MSTLAYLLALQSSLMGLPWRPVVKNPPSNAEDVGLIPGWGTKIPHAAGQLSLCAATTEPTCSRAQAPQLESLRATTTEPTCSAARVPQLERSPCATTKSPRAAVKDPACCKEDPM